METVRSENLNKLIFVHLNINTVRNKFDLLLNQIKCTADFLMISEALVSLSEQIETLLVAKLCFTLGNTSHQIF